MSADVAGICELFDWKSVMLHDDWRFRNYPVFASFAKGRLSDRTKNVGIILSQGKSCALLLVSTSSRLNRNLCSRVWCSRSSSRSQKTTSSFLLRCCSTHRCCCPIRCSSGCLCSPCVPQRIQPQLHLMPQTTSQVSSPGADLCRMCPCRGGPDSRMAVADRRCHHCRPILLHHPTLGGWHQQRRLLQDPDPIDGQC